MLLAFLCGRSRAQEVLFLEGAQSLGADFHPHFLAINSEGLHL